jgi:hypothetical protein
MVLDTQKSRKARQTAEILECAGKERHADSATTVIVIDAKNSARRTWRA